MQFSVGQTELLLYQAFYLIRKKKVLWFDSESNYY